jgi:hypothetical protein
MRRKRIVANVDDERPVNLAVPDVTPAETDAAATGLSGIIGPLGLLLAAAIGIGALVRRLGRRRR